MIKFTPKWKDDKDNIFIFPARNTVFDSWDDAFSYQAGEFIWFIPFGVSTAGILEFEMDSDGVAKIHYHKGALGQLGECCIIGGPLGPETSSEVADV